MFPVANPMIQKGMNSPRCRVHRGSLFNDILATREPHVETAHVKMSWGRVLLNELSLFLINQLARAWLLQMEMKLPATQLLMLANLTAKINVCFLLVPFELNLVMMYQGARHASPSPVPPGPACSLEPSRYGLGDP